MQLLHDLGELAVELLGKPLVLILRELRRLLKQILNLLTLFPLVKKELLNYKLFIYTPYLVVNDCNLLKVAGIELHLVQTQLWQLPYWLNPILEAVFQDIGLHGIHGSCLAVPHILTGLLSQLMAVLLVLRRRYVLDKGTLDEDVHIVELVELPGPSSLLAGLLRRTTWCLADA